MKVIAIVMLVGIVFAVIMTGAILGVLGYINEENKKRCGNCFFYDRDLRICWGDTAKKGEYAKGCDRHVKKADDER